MKSATFLAAALLSACATAAPFMNKRDYVTNVVTQEVVETVFITTTVWVDPPSYTPEAAEEPVAQDAEPTGGAFYEVPAAAPAPSPAAPQVQAPAAVPSVAPVVAPAPALQVTQAPAAAPAPAPAPVSQAPAPAAPAPQPAAPSVEQPAAAPAPAYTPPAAPSTPSTGSGQFSGEMTYYTPGMGACGDVSTESDWIVAIAQSQFDEKSKGPNPNLNGWCGQKININYMGKSYSATVVDRCTGCKKGDLDMPVAMFNTVTQNTGDGRTYSGMTWDLA